ncbi:uncharacterized protein G2W53_001282 [Senna tora]|uniref:Uncharacterized protein n=1 Tax=Senna tora TaxID=362788 RepID=A0A834XFW9_9FABA|nr:uncharacterized protein G2W53_001282 [Senna tora]
MPKLKTSFFMLSLLRLTAELPHSPSGLTVQRLVVIRLQNNETEIGEFGVTVGIEEYVGGLDVHVDNHSFSGDFHFDLRFMVWGMVMVELRCII